MDLDLANGDVKSTTDDSPSAASISSMDLADDDDDEDIRELERLLAERKARKKNKRSAVDNENARSNSSDECSKLEVDLAGLDKTPETASASASAESAASTGEDTSRTTAAESMVTPDLKEEVRKTSEVPKENESGSAERESNSKPNDILNTEAGGKLDTEGKPVSSNKDAETSEVCEAEMIEDSTENLTDKSKGDGAKRNKKRRQRWVNDNRSSPQKSASDEIETEASPANEAQTSETEREESERRAQAEALKKLDEAARKSKRETEGDSFEVVGMASSSMDDAKTEVKANERKADAVDDDEEFGEFGEFDDSNEMDFFNGRMSSQFEVATEMFDTQKKKGNKTTIVLVGILAVVVLVIVAIVII